jgi:hypothetical protein
MAPRVVRKIWSIVMPDSGKITVLARTNGILIVAVVAVTDKD